jgi:catechol 2,3-dioxygenase-like lactoylglutathione lyase family enzyme
MSNSRLTFVAISVSDLDRSTWFYRDILVIPLREESHDSELNDPWYGGNHAALSWTDGAFIHFAIYPSREPLRPTTRGAQIGFHVADFDRLYARAKANDIEVAQDAREEPWGRTARFLDPDDNIVSITER